MPLGIAAESNTKPIGTIPMATMGRGDSTRPFTLKNLEVPNKFSGIKHPMVTMWLIEMLHWIRLSKVCEDDF